jgi:hypothetical protein
MEMLSSIGGLIPLWILGAPLVAGLIAWMSAPKTTTRHDADSPWRYPAAAGASSPGIR